MVVPVRCYWLRFKVQVVFWILVLVYWYIGVSASTSVGISLLVHTLYSIHPTPYTLHPANPLPPPESDISNLQSDVHGIPIECFINVYYTLILSTLLYSKVDGLENDLPMLYTELKSPPLFQSNRIR